ncbi:hypothetical protein EV421DRAFT_307437 [Armillaria borealis]|uniref:F-box domain-containing protein n=1 Tax=Armillaria borealis TaxID=47425 RepID=A0AA39MD29_9AGAR|nr:hypothetical protein EV421DRAFT_307437 [Armillaria borealis]
MACPVCNANQNLDYYSGAAQTFGYFLPSSLEPFILANAPPSHDDCPLIRDSLSSLSAKSAHLRDIIAEQDEAIAMLSLILDYYEDAREEMLCEQSRVQDLVERHRRALSSPIRRLPIDIMREIFLLASSNAADVTDFAWIATHTCTEWRDIATQTPILWSKIHVATDIRTYIRPNNFIVMPELEWLRSTSKGASNAECVGRALDLSRDVPLVTSFIKPAKWGTKDLSDQDVEMLDMLLDHAPRWKVACLDASHGGALFCDKLQRLRGRVPMLESVSINSRFAADGSTYPYDILNVAPRLCTVVIRDSPGQLVFPWQQIKRLILNGLYHDMSYLLRVLHSVKNVEHLTICHCGGTADVSTSVILPAIHTLDLLSDLGSLYLPSGMILPALEKLHVEAGKVGPWRNTNTNTITPDFMTKVGELLKSSGCVLTHATFLPIVDFGPAFEDVISQCPTLTYLDVGFTSPRENIEEVFSFINRPNMLPALWTLKIAFSNCNLAEDGPCIGERFAQTAFSRKHSSLRIFEGSVHIKADKKPPYTPILSATDKASLEELKAEGMSITVSMNTKRIR